MPRDGSAQNLSRRNRYMLLRRSKVKSSVAWLAFAAVRDYRCRMGTLNLDDDQGDHAGAETDAERQHRLAWEAEMIAEAEAEVAAGLYVDWQDMRAWIDSVGTDHELPLPPVRQR